jgi:hypothetical protein
MFSPSRKRFHVAFAFAFWLASHASDGIASPVVTKSAVKFDQLESKATLRYEVKKGTEVDEFGDDKKISLRMDDDLNVEVSTSHANVVLFKYSARDIVKTPTDDKIAADKFAEALTSLVKVFAGAGAAASAALPAPAAPRVFLEDIDLDSLAKRVQWTFSTWKEGSTAIDKMLDAGTISEARRDARRWVDDLKRNDPTDDLARFPALWLKAISPTSPIRCRIETANQIKDCTANRSQIAATLAANGVANAQMYMDLIAAIEFERKNLLAQVADIRDLSAAITADEVISLANVPHDQENNQDLTIDVAANSRFESMLSDDAKKFRNVRIGAYTITFAPYELIHMRPSLGAIYSFVKSPKFSVARSEAGELTIAGETDDYVEFEGMVAMDFVHDKFVLKGVQLFGQAGVCPDSDNLGIALGVGVRAYKSFTFSLGAVYQRVDKLAPGLAVGDVIAEESGLKTKNEFKLGFYVGVAVKFE